MTSRTTSVAPDALKTFTWPLAPTFTTARLAAVSPVTRLRLDAVGAVSPEGNTVRYVGAVGPAPVTFSTTAATPVSGTPPRPSTVTAALVPAVTLPAPANRLSTVSNPVRVSSNRAGGTATMPLPVIR